MEMDKLFVAILVMQLFYSFSITLVTHAMPADSLDFVTSFSDATTNYDFDSTTSQVETSLSSQTSIPVIELGALVFYSGNILIDLFLNFITAVPQMLGFLVAGFTMLWGFDAFAVVIIESFVGAIWFSLYMFGIIQLLTNMRSGGRVI